MSGALTNKVVMVTGGASGIGRATCLVLAREEAKLVVADTSSDQGMETVEMVRQAGGEAIFSSTDVSNEEQVNAAVSAAVHAFGRLDGAFNNAAMPEELGGLMTSNAETVDRIFSVNVKGLWLCMRAQVKQMLKQGKTGAIVNTASVAGLRGAPTMPVYSASKHAVIGLTKSAALEFSRSALRINAICPGFVDTPMLARTIGESDQARSRFLRSQPVGRFGAPNEIAEAAAWLLSDAATFVTGIAMPVDGGLAI